MGIDPNALRFLVDTRRAGADFRDTATIGRQNLHRLSPRGALKLLDEFVEEPAAGSGTPATAERERWADWIFRRLGAASVSAIDVSNYEGASIVHDMNTPLPPGMEERFTVVFDGGSLEHIFNFPVALLNCMRLVSVGGYLVSCGPGNNFFGHGFYQFSPELWFRALSEASGFGNVEVFAVEDHHSTQAWFEVKDPETVRRRVTFNSAIPTQLFVRARKLRTVTEWSPAPFQSDYQRAWAAGDANQPVSPTAWREIVEYAKALIKTVLFPGPRRQPDVFLRRSSSNIRATPDNALGRSTPEAERGQAPHT